jgi:sugar phosphate isomerase/epimerase
MKTTCSRRMFLRRAALATLAVSFNGAARAGGAPNSFRFRYILASTLYGTMKLEEILPEVRKTGAEHIDLWPRPHGNQREQLDEIGHERFAEMLERHQVRVGILSRYDLGPFALLGEMRVAAKLGARLIICHSRGPKGLSGGKLREEIKQFAEQMKPHIAAAEEHNVIIGIENHSGALVASPDGMRWLVEFCESRHIGIALAPYHLEQDAMMMARLIEELGPRLVHFYAWQHGKGSTQKLPKEDELLQMAGRGPLDFIPLVRALKRINYQGWTEPFMHPVPRGVPILESREAVTAEINRARAYLEACLEPA